MRRESILHFVRSGLESLQEVTMSTLEIVEDVRKLYRNGIRTERENPVDDVIRTHLVGWIQVAGFGRRLEWPHDDSRWIGTQMQPLPVQERRL
jgi:transposase